MSSYKFRCMVKDLDNLLEQSCVLWCRAWVFTTETLYIMHVAGCHLRMNCLALYQHHFLKLHIKYS